MRKLILLTFCIVTLYVSAQKKVLFIGNSYIYTNDLPTLISSMAASTGDKISTESNTPGGCKFQQHCTNQSMTMIRNGGWDVVVLQEQSQSPAFPIGQVQREVFPFAKILVDSIYAYSDCPEPMFFMTWGYKNGDQLNCGNYAPLCTYEGMDSLLRERYLYMGQANHASVCPVGRVWHYIRDNYKSIELYSNDGSHPSMAGSYAAACAFYTMIFEKDPTLISYHSSLDTATERIIRNVAKLVVYDSLSSWKREQPKAVFTYSNQGNSTATFSSMTDGADSWEWDFGDGTTDVGEIVTHSFAADGTYNVKLVISKHCLTDSTVVETDINDSTITILDDVDDVKIDDNTDVKIYDASGRLIYQGKNGEAPYSSLTTGVYFINRKKVLLQQK